MSLRLNNIAATEVSKEVMKVTSASEDIAKSGAELNESSNNLMGIVRKIDGMMGRFKV